MPTNGPLKTFFRQDAGMPDDEPDLTDFLLESMLKKAPAMRGAGGVPTSTALTRASAQRGPQDQQVNVTAPAYPAMPSTPPRSYEMPQMPQQGWGDVLSQVLAGAGDVITARQGGRSDYLGRAMGIQQGLRNQAYQQALAHRAEIERAQNLAREWDWRRYNAEQQAEDRAFNRSQKLKENELYERLLGKKDEEAKARLQEAKISNYKNILSRVDGRKELTLEANKLRALNPNDKDAIGAVENSLATVFRLEEAVPSPIGQHLDQMIGGRAGGAVKRELKAMVEPQGEKGLPLLAGSRSYRWLYGTPFTAAVPAAMDLAEAAGLADFSGGPQGVGKGVHLPPPTEAEAEEQWKRIVEREMWKNRRPQTPWAYQWVPELNR